MSHDLHSLIDQAAERMRRSAAARPAAVSKDAASADRLQDRLSAWQAEAALFADQFQQDLAQLLGDVAKLTDEATGGAGPAVAVAAAMLEIHRDSESHDLPEATAPVSLATDQEQDRLSALKERLSRQLQTRTASDATPVPAERPQEGDSR